LFEIVQKAFYIHKKMKETNLTRPLKEIKILLRSLSSTNEKEYKREKVFKSTYC